MADKWQAIHHLASLLTATPAQGLPPFDEVVEGVLERERQITTGLEQGIALPHAMLGADCPTRGCLGIFPGGLDFEALDGNTVHFVLLMVFPDTPEGREYHLGMLRRSISVLTDPAVRTAVLEAAEPDQVLRTICDAEASMGL